MKLFMNYCTLFLAILFTFSACDKGGNLKKDALINIPNDVTMVTAVDLPTLMEKADFDQVKTMEFYQEVIKKANEYNPVLGEVVVDPAKSGIDLSKSFYIANEVNPDNPEEMFVGVVFSLKDAKAFDNLINAQKEQNITKGDKFDLLANGNQSVAWNDKIAIFGSTNSYNDVTPIISKYFNGDANASIANDKDLQKCFSDKHDINSWVSSNAIAENEQVMMVLPMANIAPEALKDNFFHSYLDFNNGEMAGHSSVFLNKELTKDLDLLFKDEVETDFSNYVSSEGLNTLMTAAIDFKGMKQVIAERPQGMAFLNFALKEYGVTLDDIANTFGGDILIASNNNSGKPSGLFATDIIDIAGLLKFIDLALEYEMLEKISEDHYALKNSSFNMYSPTSFNENSAQFIIKDDILFASFDMDLINAIKDGSVENKVDKKLMNKVSENIFGLFMDYEVLAEMVKDDFPIEITTLEVAAKRKNSDFLLTFKDSNSNSLKQLFEMLNAQYLKSQKTTVDKTEI